MPTEINVELASEWQTLHCSHEKYEHYALLIKLISIALTTIAISSSLSSFLIILLLAILWLQEGIWKTFQTRTSNRIEAIEKAMNAMTNSSAESKFNPFYFYTHWSETRPNAITLVSEYIKNSLKPTVIYPYLPLILIVILFN